MERKLKKKEHIIRMNKERIITLGWNKYSNDRRALVEQQPTAIRGWSRDKYAIMPIKDFEEDEF